MLVAMAMLTGMWSSPVLGQQDDPGVIIEEPIPEIPRRIPPPDGLELPHELRESVLRRLRDYEDRLWEIELQPRAADIGALVKAVAFAVENGEFWEEKQFALAGRFLDLADDRYEALVAGGELPWTNQRGLLVRGYRSRIDDSYQPFGLEIPEDLDLSGPVPLLVWLHGRGDKITDLHFIQRCMERSQALGGHVAEQQDAIILHPFGRHCVGWKHAGEIDVFEAIERVSEEYPVDPAKIALAGFSMGGAGPWHIGAHYRDRFCAVHAGAGFAETARYNRLTPDIYPPEWEQTLWKVYDTPNYVRNFLNGPVLAYSGENDKQKQAADLMEEALADVGHDLRHLVGPGMGHKYDEASAGEIWSWLNEAWEAGNPDDPAEVVLQTPTLRYAKHHWLRLAGLGKHWENAEAVGRWDREAKRITVDTQNVTALDIVAPGGIDLDGYSLVIDGNELASTATGFPIGGLAATRDGGTWSWGERKGVRKRPGIQGPIDDAFLDRFIVVPPESDPTEPLLARWVDFERRHFAKRWKELLRGELIEEEAYSLDARDIEESHLVLWGDPVSNPMIAEVVDRLPIEWGRDEFVFRGKTWSTENHVPVFIFPNPVNPDRYVVINSGLTFREAHDRTNSLQNPKLPDWAVIDLRRLPDAEAPGEIVDAGFFDESWE